MEQNCILLTASRLNSVLWVDQQSYFSWKDSSIHIRRELHIEEMQNTELTDNTYFVVYGQNI